ncbi:MAG: DUF2283 domain-containing protein [Rubrobacter sp.]
MRIELDTEANTLYLYIRDEILDGEAVRTLEVEDGVYLDLDSENRPLGLEFVHADDFQDFLKRHGGRVRIPDVVENLESLRVSIAQG